MQSMTELFPSLSGLFETALPAARVIEPVQDVPGDASTTVVIEPGDQVFESLDPAGDQDWYRLDLEADERVVLAVVPDGGAALPEGRLEVVRQNGQVLDSRLIGEATAPMVISLAQAEEVFVRVVSENGGTGDYQLVADTALPIPFADPNNLLRLGLDSQLAIQGDASDVAGRRIEFAFADAGDVFDNRFATPRAADSDWTAYERQQLALAMQQFENVLDIEIVETSNQADAEIVFFAAETGGSNSNNTFNSQGFLGLAFLPTGGSLAGNVIFNTTGFGWDRNETSGDSFDGGLEQFGLGFATVLHELGHAFGLDHPYEDDERSDFFPGIVDANGDGFTDNLFNDSGDFGLNQTVFTAMSDVTGYTEHPDGVPRVFNFSSGLATRPEFGGHVGTMMALDVALLQEKYGARERVAMGDDVYELPDSQTTETGYSLIWDNGGTDTIRYQGSRDATIDLRAATLQVEDGGGGFVSFADGGNGRTNPAIGGFTIAHGVEIENAESDTGDDTLRGNTLDNILTAGSGSDTVDGGAGDDQLDGGTGTDLLSYGSLSAPSLVLGEAEFGAFVNLDLQGSAQDTGHGSDTITNFENLEGSAFGDLLTGDGAANTITGLGGGDVINGGGGDDVIHGGEGFDAIEGGAGADQLFGGTGGAAVEGDIATYFSATGPLVFDFGATTSEIEAGSSAEVLEDTIGEDIEGVAGSSAHSNTFLGDQLTGLTFFLGGAQADTFVGGSGVDQLIGLGGDDEIRGNGGADALIGEAGDDDLFGGAGGDVFFFDGVDGNDTIHDLELAADQILFTGGLFTSLAQFAITAEDADGDLAADDVVLRYSAEGQDSSLSILNVTEQQILNEAQFLLT